MKKTIKQIAIIILFMVICIQVFKNNETISTITKGGKYKITENNTCITINTEEEVELNLESATIKCETGPAINIENAKSLYITLTGENTIESNTTEELNGAIYSKEDLILTGTGNLKIKSNYDGIVSKDKITIKSGTYTINTEDDAIIGKDKVKIEDGTININSNGDGINSDKIIEIENGKITIKSQDDGIHADGKVEINGGTLDIKAHEGIEATYVKINDGTINIEATDDGINAGNKSDEYIIAIEINGGIVNIKMAQGDTDGIDSNGNLYINGGTINIEAQSPFDYDGKAIYTSGTITVNGKTTNTITNQFMDDKKMPPNENTKPEEKSR